MMNKREINKLIAKKIAEIIFVVAFLVVSVPLREKMLLVNEEKTKLAEMELNYTSISVENPKNYSMYPMSNSEALDEVEPTKIIVENESLMAEDYSLLLRISKKSTLDFNYLNLAIDDEVYALNTLTMSEDDENYYFVIASDGLSKNSKEYLIKLWIDEKTDNEMQDTKIIFSFELIKNVINL